MFFGLGIFGVCICVYLARPSSSVRLPVWDRNKGDWYVCFWEDFVVGDEIDSLLERFFFLTIYLFDWGGRKGS